MMDRRKMVVALGGCMLALGRGASAQQAAKPIAPGGRQWRIGVLRPGPDDAVWRENFAPFRQGLREMGYVEGSNLSFEFRVRPGSPDEVSALAGELLNSKVDAILAIAPAGVGAASKATSSVPIVANDMESDPIARGYAASLARPGGNVTGVFLDVPEMGGKWVQLLKETVPNLARVGVLWDPAIGPHLMKAVDAAAGRLKVKSFGQEVGHVDDLARAFEAGARQKVQAVLVLTSPAVYSMRREIAALAIKYRLPAIMSFPGFADAGGLMAYGPSLLDMFRQTSFVMAKILQGAKPGDIPIERPSRFELVVNLKTARALGLTVPQSVLLSADRVILL